ncbi:MAG: DNA cytosine methyltransferase [Alphaproteobacteria bacterium]|nr:DNA cytosine methyltransferase [Alphaproteobacteria bacterium]
MFGAQFTFHEDFSGAGMARIGLGKDWLCLRACDINTKKCRAYRNNFGEGHLFEGDIGDVKVVNAPPAQLAWASFPCQDTSLAGGYSGLAGRRSGTFWAWWRIVEGMRAAGKPYDIVCIENVRGLLTSNGGTDFAAICEALTKEGYIFGATVINASLFLPQSRERLFIVGIRGDKELIEDVRAKKPVPLWHPQSMQMAYKHLSKKAKEHWFWLNPVLPYVQKPTLEEIISDNPEGVAWHTPQETKRLISMMSPENLRKLNEQKDKGARVIGMLYKRTREGQQRAEVRFDGIAGCLRTATGGSSRQTVMIVSGQSVRSRLLAPREAARLMGLPDSYKLPEKYNDAYHLCGDGVAVPVVRFLAETVFEPVLSKIAKDISASKMVAAE